MYIICEGEYKVESIIFILNYSKCILNIHFLYINIFLVHFLEIKNEGS